MIGGIYMNQQKFTQKSLEVLNHAQHIALEHNNMQIEQEHLVYSLLDIQESLILELFKKNGLSIEGQKNILEYLKKNIRKDYHLINWTGFPRFEQSLYLLNLCFNNLTKNP